MVVMMGNDEECSTGSNPGGDSSIEGELSDVSVRVVGDNEIPRSSRHPLRQVHLQPLDPLTHLVSRCAGVCRREGGRGNVDCRDEPAVLCQPERLGPCSATRIKGGSCGQVRGFHGEVRVDWMEVCPV